MPVIDDNTTGMRNVVYYIYARRRRAPPGIQVIYLLRIPVVLSSTLGSVRLSYFPRRIFVFWLTAVEVSIPLMHLLYLN